MLSVTCVLAVGVAYLVLFSSFLSKPKSPMSELDDKYYVSEILEVQSGGKIYRVEPSSPSTLSRWTLFAGATFFLVSVVAFGRSSQNRVHTGVEVPVSGFAGAVAHLVDAQRPFLFGKFWEADGALEDAAIYATPEDGKWQIELSGEFANIAEALRQPNGPFAECEEVVSYAVELRTFRMPSSDVVSDCIWLLRDFLEYPEDTVLHVGVADDASFGPSTGQ